MSVAPILQTREALVVFLKSQATVTAILPADQIFGERSNAGAWPFSRMGEFEGIRPRHGVRGNVHVFSKEEFTNEVNRIVERIGDVLDGAVLGLEDGRQAYVDVVSTRILPDPEEQSAWHGILAIEVTIPKDCTTV